MLRERERKRERVEEKQVSVNHSAQIKVGLGRDGLELPNTLSSI